LLIKTKEAFMPEKTMEQLQAELALIRAENEALKAKKTRAQTISFKVSAKGAISVYGLGRFPVTLYASQWSKLAASMEALGTFIIANKDSLADKSQVVVETK
jgi:hypothetical protein